MLSTSIFLETITSSFGLQGTCLFIIIISTLSLAVPLLAYRNKISGEFKLCSQGKVSQESSNDVDDEDDDDCTRGLVLSEIVDPESGHNYHPRPASADSNLVNYSSYRHKLIEETLQKQYGGGYAPGKVILNLIELNTVESAASCILRNKYDRSFFDLIKIRDGVEAVCNRVEYPDQLDHFIPRNLRKRSTTEIHTEISEVNVTPITRPNTPTSFQRIITKRSREAGAQKSPVQSRTSITATVRPETPGIAKEIRLLEAPLTEQLYRRNDARPDVVSKTHVEAEAEYLNRIAKNRRGVRSSLKKCGPKVKEETSGRNKTVDCNRLRRSEVKDDLRKLSASKPTVWNN